LRYFVTPASYAGVVEPTVSADGIVSVRDGVQGLRAKVLVSHNVDEDNVFHHVSQIRRSGGRVYLSVASTNETGGPWPPVWYLKDDRFCA